MLRLTSLPAVDIDGGAGNVGHVGLEAPVAVRLFKCDKQDDHSRIQTLVTTVKLMLGENCWPSHSP